MIKELGKVGSGKEVHEEMHPARLSSFESRLKGVMRCLNDIDQSRKSTGKYKSTSPAFTVSSSKDSDFHGRLEEIQNRFAAFQTSRPTFESGLSKILQEFDEATRPSPSNWDTLSSTIQESITDNLPLLTIGFAKQIHDALSEGRRDMEAHFSRRLEVTFGLIIHFLNISAANVSDLNLTLEEGEIVSTATYLMASP
ncbi:hypothetical protein B0H34DRAFT_689910 [Crassisporium funariophilum]|nr:hypothetical protein B0H34DRAFT_689910 [Crassisporium funariophilum]